MVTVVTEREPGHGQQDTHQVDRGDDGDRATTAEATSGRRRLTAVPVTVPEATPDGPPTSARADQLS
jgi:hypothetical protein